MNKKIFIGFVTLITAGLALTACSSSAQVGEDVIAPVTVNVSELSGTDVSLELNQVLNINTDDVPTTSFDAQLSDPTVATFSPGTDDGNLITNPGFTAVSAGSTDVTLTSSDQAFTETVNFTITVSE